MASACYRWINTASLPNQRNELETKRTDAHLKHKCPFLPAGRSAEPAQHDEKHALSRKCRENYSEMRPLVVGSGFNKSELEVSRVARTFFPIILRVWKWKWTWKPPFSNNVLKYHKVWWMFITTICISGSNRAAQRFSIYYGNIH